MTVTITPVLLGYGRSPTALEGAAWRNLNATAAAWYARYADVPITLGPSRVIVTDEVPAGPSAHDATAAQALRLTEGLGLRSIVGLGVGSADGAAIAGRGSLVAENVLDAWLTDPPLRRTQLWLVLHEWGHIAGLAHPAELVRADTIMAYGSTLRFEAGDAVGFTAGEQAQLHAAWGRIAKLKTGIFVWQINSDYNIPHLPNDDAQMPMSFCFFKTNDSLTMMGNIASGAGGPVSVADVARVRDIYTTQDIGFCPWGVVKGRGDAAAEGALAGQIAAECGGLYMVDLEDGPEYWAGGDAEVDAFVLAFLNNGGRELWLCPDTRAGHLAGINFDRWLAYAQVTRIWPQIYWVDFGQDYLTAFDASLSPLNARGLTAQSGRVWPVVQADAPDLLAGTQQLDAWGYPGWALWRRGIITQANYDALQAAGGVVEPPPVLVKTYEDGLVEGRAIGRAEGIAAARDALAGLA